MPPLTEELLEAFEKQCPHILYNLNVGFQILCRMVPAFPIFSLPGYASANVLVYLTQQEKQQMSFWRNYWHFNNSSQIGNALEHTAKITWNLRPLWESMIQLWKYAGFLDSHILYFSFSKLFPIPLNTWKSKIFVVHNFSGVTSRIMLPIFHCQLGNISNQDPNYVCSDHELCLRCLQDCTSLINTLLYCMVNDNQHNYHNLGRQLLLSYNETFYKKTFYSKTWDNSFNGTLLLFSFFSLFFP